MNKTSEMRIRISGLLTHLIANPASKRRIQIKCQMRIESLERTFVTNDNVTEYDVINHTENVINIRIWNAKVEVTNDF